LQHLYIFEMRNPNCYHLYANSDKLTEQNVYNFITIICLLISNMLLSNYFSMSVIIRDTVSVVLLTAIILPLVSDRVLMLPILSVYAQGNNITGTEGRDILNGTAASENITSLGGVDIISALAGNDNIRGGPENDTIYGNIGEDRIKGGAGNDTITGNEGRDRIWGSSGNDNIDGGPGNDVLYGGTGNDMFTGGPGKDTFRCGDGPNDRIVDYDLTKNETKSADCELITSPNTGGV
jgi:hypothetical protein